MVAGCRNGALENNKKEHEEIIYERKYGTSSTIKFKDDNYGLIEIVSYGECSYKINESYLINNESAEESIFDSLISSFSFVIKKFNVNIDFVK